MRALITGIDGFVGQYLAKELAQHGYQVFGTTIGQPTGNIHHLELTDPEGVTKMVTDVKPDSIYHLAGFTSVKASWDNPDEALRINRDGTRHLYLALQRQKLAPRVLITSSAEVYGIPQFLPISETHPTQPMNPYAESKLAQERVAREFPYIPTTIARSFPHIGPGQSSTFVTSSFAEQIVQVERGQATAVQVGNLEAVRDFTDVRDVVIAYRLLLEPKQRPAIYNVCSGTGYRLQDILNRLLSMSSKPNMPVHPNPQRLRPSDIPRLVGDHTKLTAATGWGPRLSLNETLLNIYQSYSSA